MFKSFKKYVHRRPSANTIPSMQEIIKPLYIVLSLLGLFPYSVKFSKTKNYLKIITKSIYINSLCGISVILTIIGFVVLHIQDLFLSNENISMTEAIMTQINYAIEIINFVIFCTTAYISAFLNREVYIRILNRLNTIWIEMPTGRNNNKILNRLKFQVHVVVMSSLLILFIIQLSVNFSRNNSVWKVILVTITFNLPQMIQFVTLAFYYALVMMLVAIMANINDNCLELESEQKIDSDGCVKVNQKPLESLRHLESAYIKAFEIRTYINEAFEAPILASAIQCFHSTVSEAHIIYHGLVIAGSLKTHEFVNCFIWIIYQLLKIYTMAHSGNMLKREALKIGQRLHSISTDKKDARWLLEIQHFSSLMSCQKFELTVYEYFPLDGTLIYNMLASATMYLIILVQFDKRV